MNTNFYLYPLSEDYKKVYLEKPNTPYKLETIVEEKEEDIIREKELMFKFDDIK